MVIMNDGNRCMPEISLASVVQHRICPVSKMLQSYLTKHRGGSQGKGYKLPDVLKYSRTVLLDRFHTLRKNTVSFLFVHCSIRALPPSKFFTIAVGGMQSNPIHRGNDADLISVDNSGPASHERALISSMILPAPVGFWFRSLFDCLCDVIARSIICSKYGPSAAAGR